MNPEHAKEFMWLAALLAAAVLGCQQGNDGIPPSEDCNDGCGCIPPSTDGGCPSGCIPATYVEVDGGKLAYCANMGVSRDE
jgi:hypothetical protein